MEYVIIGNSIAAAGCVEGIRSVDGEGNITVIGEENYHVYSRPLISYLLQGRTDEERMKYRPGDFYEKNHCRLHTGVRARRIDPVEKKVYTDDGEAFGYDRLLVAAGSTPFVPPMNGLEQVKNRFSFMTLDDAKALEAALTPASRVLIVGGGLIGLKCAEGLADRVGRITVVDLASRILSSILDDGGAARVQRHLEAKGLRFLLGTSVEKFFPDRAVVSGEEIPFDILVLAVGVRPNVFLIKEAGGEVRRGIVTDARMRTTLPDVYAAGDCAESFDISSETERVLALLPNAWQGGFAAGVNMAGGEKDFDRAFPMNAIGFFGLHMVTAGVYEGDCYEACDGENYKKLFYRDDRLVGFILIGDVTGSGIYTALLRERRPLNEVDFALLCKSPCLAAFSRKDRDKILGGAQK